MSARELVKARELIGRGELTGAIRLLRSVIGSDPADAVAHADLAQALWRAGRSAEGAKHAELAARLVPNSPSFHFLHGFCLGLAGDLDGAIAAMDTARRMDPSNPDFYVPLIEAFASAMRFDSAADLAREGLARFPHLPALYASLASSLSQMGEEAGADAILDDAARRFPDDLFIAVLRATIANYRDGIDRGEVLARHRSVGRIVGDGALRLTPCANDPHPDRTLRVGVISPDFRTHSVAYFVDPVLFHLGPGFAVHAVSTTRDADETTRSLRDRLIRGGGSWHEAAPLDLGALARLVRSLKVDVLVDLAGLMHNHRLPLLALRTAPVQVSAIGYPNTTGLETVDLRPVDSLTDPPGEEAWHTESLARIDPCFLAYAPPADAPDPAPGPCGAGGPVTFGSFNAVTKLSDRTLRLWARVLDRSPGSRLVLKIAGGGSPLTSVGLRERAARAGLDPERLVMLDRARSTRDHLALYARMDVALDTFPYHGTTTTCEALFMGVPVVTRVGDRHASRVGLSLLSAAGSAGWAATDDDGFVRIAAGLAADPAGLLELRRTLRPRLLASALCDTQACGRRLAGAFRDRWRAWCQRVRTAGRG